jgi:hypothetical protein
MSDTIDIETAHVTYQLDNGCITRWLVAGPASVEIANLDRFSASDFRSDIAAAFYDDESGVTQPPAEQSSFEIALKGGESQKLTWRPVRCGDDNLIDLSDVYPTCHYLAAWAYVQLVAPLTVETNATVTFTGPVDIWVNGKRAFRQQSFPNEAVATTRFPLAITEGHNEILVRFETVALAETPFVFGLDVEAAHAGGYSVALPTTLEPLPRRQLLQDIFEAAYLEYDVYHTENRLIVHWPKTMKRAEEITLRLQTPSARIYGEAQLLVRPGTTAPLGSVTHAPDGDYHVLLMPKLEEYYVHGMRIQHRLPMHIAGGKFATVPFGTYENRRHEALDFTARRGGLHAEIAKMALGRWNALREKSLEQAVNAVARREAGSTTLLLLLLGMVMRFGENESFPEELAWTIADAALAFRYAPTERGLDALDLTSEHEQIVAHTCEILAGQLYPDRIFAGVDRNGEWRRQNGERLALEWMRDRCHGGFRAWDSPHGYDAIVAALTHLIELAQSDEVAEMAAVTLDKVLFSLALNSYRGVFASSHGAARSAAVKSGRMQPTSGIARLAWGLGAFTAQSAGTLSLACAESYELPPMIAGIAADMPEEVWSRERHAGYMEAWRDGDDGAWEVNKVAYKTPDYMLASAQDWRAGQPGRSEHIWQATFGPDAVVFVNHPACSSDSNAHQPNFWCGNAVLPRVAQWKDVLIAVHKVPDDDRMGFTHAYFPRAAFDEFEVRGHWAFGRKGDGYIALMATNGLREITQGPSAMRELRSYGQNTTWLCQMGRASLDGAFADFIDKVMALDMAQTEQGVKFLTLRGDVVEFGWEGPLRINGAEQPLSGFPHFDSPYCTVDLPATSMEIRYLDLGVRLNFDL